MVQKVRPNMKYLAVLFAMLSYFPVCAQTEKPTVSPKASPTTSPPETTVGGVSEAARKMQDFLDEDERTSNRRPGTSILPDASSLDRLDPNTKEEYYAAMREYYRYRVIGYQHRADIFRWQFLSSKIIFFVVILLVLSGVYFSGVQFHSSLRHKKVPEVIKEGVAQVAAIDQHDITQIEASLKGIRVSSPVLGILILIISFLFFYLYLIYVYPIVNTL